MFGRNVVYLHGVKQVNNEQDQLRRILQGVRCKDNEEGLSEEDIKRLLELDINHMCFSKSEREEIEATSMYLFANKEPQDALITKTLAAARTASGLKCVETHKGGDFLVQFLLMIFSCVSL